jgi:hypothetical protein
MCTNLPPPVIKADNCSDYFEVNYDPNTDTHKAYGCGLGWDSDCTNMEVEC